MDLFITLENGVFQFLLDGELIIKFQPQDGLEMANWFAAYDVTEAMLSSSVDFGHEQGVSNARGIIQVALSNAAEILRNRRV